MNWQDGIIAVDWGTTNRRAYRLDAGGACVDRMDDGCGVLSVAPGAFGREVDAIRARLGDLPMLLVGMVGSNRGWIEVPYAPAPATLADLRAAIHWIEPGIESGVEPGRTGIVPGVSWTGEGQPDVMRGEEVQVLGAVAAGLVANDALICHPGTHTKWITVAGGAIGRFRTSMVGEIFALLREHSILSSALTDPVTLGADFEAGVAEALDGGDVLSDLFSVRATAALGRDTRGCASFVSGLLIGSAVQSAVALAPGVDVALMGRPDLVEAYGRALDLAGRPATTQIDGATAFLAGCHALLKDAR